MEHKSKKRQKEIKKTEEKIIIFWNIFNIFLYETHSLSFSLVTYSFLTSLRHLFHFIRRYFMSVIDALNYFYVTKPLFSSLLLQLALYNAGPVTAIWKSRILHVFLWKSLILHVFRWKSRILHIFWWKSRILHIFSWKSHILYNRNIPIAEHFSDFGIRVTCGIVDTFGYCFFAIFSGVKRWEVKERYRCTIDNMLLHSEKKKRSINHDRSSDHRDNRITTHYQQIYVQLLLLRPSLCRLQYNSESTYDSIKICCCGFCYDLQFDNGYRTSLQARG